MQKPKLNRREFLKIAWITATSLFLKACNNIGLSTTAEPANTSPTIEMTGTPKSTEVTATSESIQQTPPSDPTPTSSSAHIVTKGTVPVALVKTSNRSEGVKQAIALLGVNPVQGKRVFLKPNFNSSDPAPGSTHPDILRSLIQQLQQMGASKITLGDRSGMGDTAKVMREIGVPEIAKEFGLEVIVFDDLQAEEWELFSPKNSNWNQGIPFVRPALESDVIIQACCIKTHRYGGNFTMSLKNSVGLVAKTIPGDGHNFMTELHNSPHQRKMIAEINQLYQPGLIIMDGVHSFTSGGPDTGTVADSQILLAGTDRVAMDAVGVAVLRKFGTTPAVEQGAVFNQEQIARAVELEIGIDSPGKISFLTDDEASEQYAQELKQILLA